MFPRSRTSVPLVALGLFLFACDREGPTEPAMTAPILAGLQAALVQSVPDVCGQESTALLAAKLVDVGTVTVSNDEDMLYVTFETTGGWSMAETQVAVVATPEELPRRGGHIAPGLFPERAVHTPPATTVHYAVPLAALGGQGVAVVAAHADVVKGEMAEGAWADGTEVDEGGSWESYFSYGIADCDGDVVVVIGSEGGEVDLGAAGTLTIEPGTLGGDVEITASPVPAEDLPPGVLPGTAFDFGPDGLAFDPPATLILHYDDTGLTLPQEEALAIHIVDSEGDLTALPSDVDTGANTVTAEVAHFSVYAIPTPVGALQLSGPDVANEGGTVEHVVEFLNLSGGSIPTTDLTVELTVDGPVTPASPPPECTLDSAPGDPLHYTCTRAAPLPAPGVWILTFAHDVDAGSAGSGVTAVASYSYQAPGGSTFTGMTPTHATAIEPPLPQADLGVNVAPPDGPMVVGLPMDFIVTVGNIGPSFVEDATLMIQIRQDIPWSVTETTLTGPFAEECAAPVQTAEHVEVVCTVPSLGSGANLPLTVTVTVGTVGSIELWAAVTDDGTTDPFADNDEATELIFVNPSP